MDITPSTRPLQAINNVETLMALRAQVKTNGELAQWQQLADRELASLAHFTKEGEGRLQRSSSNLQTAQAADERTRSEAEVTHIKGLLDQLDVATGRLTAARRQAASRASITASPTPVMPVSSAAGAPKSKTSVSTTVTVVIVSALVLLVVAGAVISSWPAPSSRSAGNSQAMPPAAKSSKPVAIALAATSTPAATYLGEETPMSICDNMRDMTSAQWQDYFMKLEGKRVDHWTGWVLDVKNNFTNLDTVVVDVSIPYSLLTNRQTMINIPHDQALLLKKRQQIEIAGTLLGAIDINGVCAISFKTSRLI